MGGGGAVTGAERPGGCECCGRAAGKQGNRGSPPPPTGPAHRDRDSGKGEGTIGCALSFSSPCPASEAPAGCGRPCRRAPAWSAAHISSPLPPRKMARGGILNKCVSSQLGCPRRVAERSPPRAPRSSARWWVTRGGRVPPGSVEETDPPRVTRPPLVRRPRAGPCGAGCPAPPLGPDAVARSHRG